MLKDLMTNVTRATNGSHILALCVGVGVPVAGKFMLDPHVTAFISGHWWAQYPAMLISGVGGLLLVYYKAQKPMA